MLIKIFNLKKKINNHKTITKKKKKIMNKFIKDLQILNRKYNNND